VSGMESMTKKEIKQSPMKLATISLMKQHV